MTAIATYYQIGCRFALSIPQRDIVRDCFLSCGIELSLLVEEVSRDSVSVSFYTETFQQAKGYKRTLDKNLPELCQVFIKTHKRNDWETRWKKGWKPFSLTKRFHVIPLWQENRQYPDGKTPVFLETTNAFGTGLHETTRFTAQYIEDLSGFFDSFLDVGTGSGILAIVALKCQARKVRAFDIDAGAVAVARENLKANGLVCKVEKADIKTFKSAKRFDLVAANLVSADLISFRDQICALVLPGGYLIVSGISRRNLLGVLASFAAVGALPQRIRRGRSWCAVLFAF